MSETKQPKLWVQILQNILKAIFKNLGGRTSKNTHNQHVVPHEEGWAVKGEGNQRVTGTYKYQDDAINRAKEIATNYKSSVVIHRKDGTIRDKVSYK